jgi:O-antigen/teichoic acid export membrane protein
VAYYSIAFSMAEKLLLGSTIFAGAIGATIFAQYGRDKSRLPLIASFSVRYLALVSIPLHLIAVSLAVPALLLLYGHQYSGAATVAMLAPLLCLPKAFIDPATNLLQSCERQSFIIAATVLAGVVDVGVAWWLVSAHGAVGACIGSGVAQLTAVGIVWAAAIRIYRVRLPWRFLAKVIFVSLCASLAAHGVARQFVPLWGVLGGGGAAMIVFFALFYLLRVLEPEDGARLEALIQMLPGRIRDAAKMLETFLIRPTPVSNG